MGKTGSQLVKPPASPTNAPAHPGVPKAGSSFSISIPQPGGVVAAYGAVWVQSALGRSLWKISPQGHVLAKIPGVSANPALLYAGVGGGGIQTLTAGVGSVWSLVGDEVLRIDPATGNVTATIPVARLSSSIATGFGSVWVDSQRAKLDRIDPASNTVISKTPLSASSAALTIGEGYVWDLAISEAARVSKIDPVTGRILSELESPARAFLVTSLGRLWVADHDGYFGSIDVMTGVPSQSKRVAQAIMGVTASGGIVWVNGGDLVGIDASTGKVVIRVKIEPPQQASAGIAVLGHQVWLVEPGQDTVVAVTMT